MTMTHFSYHTIQGVLLHWAAKKTDHEILVFLHDGREKETVTYGLLCEDALRYANWLIHQGVRPRDLVLLAFDHGYHLVRALIGTLFAGALPTVHPYVSSHGETAVYGHRLKGLIRSANVRAVLTSQEHLPILSHAVRDGCPVWAPHHPLVDLPPLAEPCQVKATDAAYVQFSSGATGAPKGVPVTHRALFENMTAFRNMGAFDTGDTAVGWMPLFHDGGLVMLLWLPLLSAGKSVLMDPRHWVKEPHLLFRAIHDHRGAFYSGPNFAYSHCVRRIHDRDMEGIDLSCLRYCGSGSEMVDHRVLDRFVNRFRPYGLKRSALKVIYGMAENVLMSSATSVEDQVHYDWVSNAGLKQGAAVSAPENTPGSVCIVSCGAPAAGTEIDVWDHRGKPLAERFVGEVVFRGTSLFSGYYNQLERHDDVMRDGWFRSGDLGYLVKDELFIIGRKKDLIIIGGENIHPESIETVARIAAGDSVGRVAAFGVYDPVLGSETPVVIGERRRFIEERDESEITAKIRRMVRDELGVALGDVRLVDRSRIVVTTSGKIARQATRDNYLANGCRPEIGALEMLKTAGDDPAMMVSALMVLFACKLGINVTAVDPGADFFKQGVESLLFMDILATIEKALGRPIPVRRIVAAPTILHLAQMLCRPGTVETINDPHPTSFQTVPAPPVHPEKLSHPLRIRKIIFENGPVVRRCALHYGLGVRMQRAWLTKKSVQAGFFGDQIEIINHWIKLVGGVPSPQETILRSLMFNTWRSWRVTSLCGRKNMRDWVAINGADVLEAAKSQGRGVVLGVPHTTVINIIRRIAQKYYPDQVSIEPAAEPDLRFKQKIALQLYEARRALRRGGMVVVAMDGFAGNSGVLVDFFGGKRRFYYGAAELAVQNKAWIVPAFAHLYTDGRLAIEFLEPLAPENDKQGDAARSLTTRYAKIYRDRWPRDLGNRYLGHLERCLRNLEPYHAS